MARDVTRMLRKLKGNPRFRALPRSAQQMLMDLVLDPALNAAGVVPLMVDRWAFACDEMTVSDVRSDLGVLAATRFVVMDRFEAMVCGYLRDSGVTGHPHHFKAALRAVEAAESPLLRQALAIELYELGRDDTADVIEALAPLSDPVPSAMASGSERDGIAIPNGSEADRT